jgi:hypothetical protein
VVNQNTIFSQNGEDFEVTGRTNDLRFNSPTHPSEIMKKYHATEREENTRTSIVLKPKDSLKLKTKVMEAKKRRHIRQASE